MNKHINLVLNFDSEIELGEYVDLMQKAGDYEDKLITINAKLRSILKHCPMEATLHDDLENIRVLSII